MRGNFFYQRLGEKVSSERKKKKISQNKLSTLCEVHRTYIAKIEEGRANPSVRILLKITNGLRVSLFNLFQGL